MLRNLQTLVDAAENGLPKRRGYRVLKMAETYDRKRAKVNRTAVSCDRCRARKTKVSASLGSKLNPADGDLEVQKSRCALSVP